ncbi:hypothetical protein Dimus_006225 [Dionaea muscipula]
MSSKAAQGDLDLGDSCALIAHETMCGEAAEIVASDLTCGGSGGVERDSAKQVEGIEEPISCASQPSWADECDVVKHGQEVFEVQGALLQNSTPVGSSGGFFRALTQGKDREKLPQEQAQRVSMEGGGIRERPVGARGSKGKNGGLLRRILRGDLPAR